MAQADITITPHVDLSELSKLQVNLDLDQYFGLWAVEDTRFLTTLDHVARMDLAEHVLHSGNDGQPISAIDSRNQASGQVVLGLVRIEGTMTKRGSSLSRAGSTVRLRQEVRKQAKDPEVGGILLVIDSPGGTVAGTADLAREVREAAKKKPVYAFVEDLTASAAYWVASQATKVFANDETALIGSIGTYVGLYDYSAAAEKEGIKAIVIRSGEYKGTGFPGTEISEEQTAYFQAIVDSTQAQFTAEVASGRQLSVGAVGKLADGRIHLAADALKLSLIDGIQTFDETVDQLAELVGKTKSETTGASQMADDNTQTATPTAASYQELVAALPKGTCAEFICEQQAAGATLAEAKDNFITRQQETIKAKDEQLAKATAKKIGVEPLAETGLDAHDSVADPIATWKEKVAEKVKAGMKKDRAASAVNRENPGLREAYVAACNA